MTRDNKIRLGLFSCHAGLEVRRIALNMDQVRQYGPPPNPAKITDSRANDYIKRYGADSWELDALEPGVIERLVEREVQSLITDKHAWDEAADEENTKRVYLRRFYSEFPSIAEFMERKAVQP